MTGIVVPPLGYYPFECDQTSVIFEKESQECQTSIMNSQNTNNKTIVNSLNTCS